MRTGNHAPLFRCAQALPRRVCEANMSLRFGEHRYRTLLLRLPVAGSTVPTALFYAISSDHGAPPGILRAFPGSPDRRPPSNGERDQASSRSLEEPEERRAI